MLRIFLKEEEYSEKSGDLEEVYSCLVDEIGLFRAKVWFFFQLVKVVPVFIMNSIFWRSMMLRNYFKTMLRMMKRQKVYSFINIFGLAVGMSCFILLMLYVKYELSFDRFHQNSERIFRIVQHLPTWNYRNSTDFAITTAALAPALMEEFPEVIRATRMLGSSGPIGNAEHTFLEEGFYADEHFLNIFSFPLVTGDQNTVLNEPFSIVISERFSRKLFGDENPLGNVIIVSNKNEYKVTGILEDVASNSHLSFDYLLSFSTLKALGRRDLTNWDNINYATYVLLQDGKSYLEFEKKLPAIVEKYHPYESEEEKLVYFLQPLKTIHLQSHLNFEISSNSDLKYVYLFSSIAFIIMIIGCINYMNLATARSVKRYKEVGIRKTVGAQRFQLMKQFLGESLFLTFLAVIVTVFLVVLIIPHFGSFVNRAIDFELLTDWKNVLGLFGLFVGVGLLSGSYSAFLLSSFQPVNALKNTTKMDSFRNPMKLRNILVVFQFCVSVILIVSAIVIQKQLYYIKYRDVGYCRDNIVTVHLWDETSRTKALIIKEDLLKNPSILGAAVSSRPPIRISNVGDAQVEGDKEGETLTIAQINCASIDYDYIDLYDIKILEGRNFSPTFGTDEEQGVIVNETTVKKLGLKELVGKRISRWDIKEGRIIGVVKDFHFATFRLKIEPMMFLLRPQNANLISLKISSNNIRETLEFVESTFRRHSNHFIFDYAFLDDAFNNIYQTEQKLGTILTLFSVIAIIIASLGLFGLVSFVAERKTREVGIRKVLGASVSAIIRLIVNEFLLLVLISNLIAAPIAYFLMNQWLQSFVYRIDLGFSIFLLSGMASLFITLITVSYQSFKAALANPVDSLRYE